MVANTVFKREPVCWPAALPVQRCFSLPTGCFATCGRATANCPLCKDIRVVFPPQSPLCSSDENKIMNLKKRSGAVQRGCRGPKTPENL